MITSQIFVKYMKTQTTLQTTLIGKWNEENFYTCSHRQKVPLHQASPLQLWLSLLSYLRVPTMLAVKSTLVLYAYTYPFIYTLTHTLEQGSTNCGTQAKPGCQFCKQSFILTVMLICLHII